MTIIHEFTSNLELNYPLLAEHATYLKAIGAVEHVRRLPEIMKEPDGKREAVGLPCGPQGQYTTIRGGLIDLSTPRNPASGRFVPPDGEPGNYVPWGVTGARTIGWNGIQIHADSEITGWLSLIVEKMLIPWGYILTGECCITQQGINRIITVSANGSLVERTEEIAKPVAKPKAANPFVQVAAMTAQTNDRYGWRHRRDGHWEVASGANGDVARALLLSRGVPVNDTNEYLGDPYWLARLTDQQLIESLNARTRVHSAEQIMPYELVPASSFAVAR